MKKTGKPYYSWSAFLALMAALVVLGYVKGSDAQELDVRDRKWEEPVKYYLMDGCGDSVYDLIYQAVSEIETRTVPFTYVSRWRNLERDSLNTIGCAYESPFTDDLKNLSPDIGYIDYHVKSDDGLFTKGTARTWFITSTGQIIEFDIWLSLHTISLNPKGTIMHELVHAVGLAHSLSKDSLMYRAASIDYWDAETVGRLSLVYETCEPEIDESYNIWIPKLNVTDPQTGEKRDIYAVLVANGDSWSLESAGDSECP